MKGSCENCARRKTCGQIEKFFGFCENGCFLPADYAEFNRKYLIDFIKLCKTTAAKLKTNYSKYIERKVNNYMLTAASPDGTAESMLLSMIPNWRNRTY